MAAVLVTVACASSGTEATATPSAPALMVEELSCQDFYPGIPGPVAHWVQVQGSLGNPDGPALQDAFVIVHIKGMNGDLLYELEPDSGPFRIPTGSTQLFHVSRDLPQEVSVDGGTCSVAVLVDGEQIPLGGETEGLIEALYAP